MLRIAHDLVERRLSDALIDGCGLAINEFDALLYLYLQGEGAVRLGALAEGVALSQPALSRLAARLSERGFILRSSTEDDGRAANLCLSDDGRRLIQRAIGIHSRVIEETLTGRISDAEQRDLIEILSRIGC